MARKATKKETTNRVESVKTTESEIIVTFEDGRVKEFLPPQDSFEDIPNPILFEHTQEPSSESITEGLSEQATQLSPEGENAPIGLLEPLELIPNDVGLEVVTDLPQNINISLQHTDIISFVRDILYISHLGGEIPFGNYTNLRRFPFCAEMSLPYSAKEAWENRPTEPVQHERGYTITLSHPDANIFANKLVELGKQGAILQGGVLTMGLCQAKLSLFNPVREDKPYITLGLDKFKYTREELHLMEYNTLKALGTWYGVKVGSKAGLIKAILDKQAEVNWN